MFNNNKKNGRRISIGTIVCASVAVIALAICAILMIYTELPSVWIIYGALGGYLIFLLSYGVITLVRRRMRKEDFFAIRESVFGTLSRDFMKKLFMPILISDEKGKIVWHNDALKAHFPDRAILRNAYVDTICNVPIEQIIAEEKVDENTGEPVEEKTEIIFKLSDKAEPKTNQVFYANAYPVHYQKKTYYITIFHDILEIKQLKERLVNEDAVVAYVIIDNLEELVMHVQEVYGTATTAVEKLLRDIVETGYVDKDERGQEIFVPGMGGVVRPYGQNKYLLIFEAQKYAIFEKERFGNLLDKAREIRVGEASLPVTLSIGVAKIEGSLYEKERAAQAALDMALQRGGDQAVVKMPEGLSFYGGKTQAAFKRTKVRARILAKELLHLIAGAENVLVMGHKFPDFDALASCLAIFRLAKFCGTDAYIVCDKNTPALATCFRRLDGKPEYEHIFLDKTTAQNRIRSGSLAIVVDVNNMKVCEAPDIINMVQDFIVIDHHRQTAEFTVKPKICYIDPLASSTSELLSEFLEQIFPSKAEIDKPITYDLKKFVPKVDIPRVELDLLLAGIVLDTKNYTSNTNERTFSAAMYLRSLGADPMRVKDFFKIDYDDFRSEVGFETNLQMYRDHIMIAMNENENNPPSAKINAARAADRLLNVENVEASFALCRIGDTVHISARSQGRINVQLILEKMGGGGHFDSAGAQMKDSTVSAVLPLLREAIDESLAEQQTKKDKQA